jgi:hypothetical protein
MSQALITLLSAQKARDLVPVTPSDSVNLTDGLTIGLYIGVSGNVSVVTKSGQTRILVGLAAGIIHPIPVTRVNSTATTATSIVAVY